LAKEDLASDLIFDRAGALTFTDEGEMIQAAIAFASQPLPKGSRVGLITNTGGPAVIATDILVGAGLTLPPLSDATQARLKETLFPEASVKNPVDVLATGTAEHYRACMDAMMEDDAFDAVLVHFVTPFFVDTDSIAREIAEVNRQRKKPLVCNLMTDRKQWTETVGILKEAEVPFFALPGEAARAMASLVRYHKIQSRPAGEIQTFTEIRAEKARGILENAQAAGRNQLAAEEVYRILDAYGFPTASWRTADDPDAAAKAAEEIGFPVVLKADAASVLHKSDMGGVAVNLADADAVREAAERMQSNIDADDLRFFVQAFVPDGLEVILGAKSEPGLGHLLMFGLGGIFVEVLKDVVFRLTPVTDAEAGRMLEDITGAPLLEGVRGQKGVDRAALASLIQRLSRLVSDLPEIAEMDLNPVKALSDRVVVVDARIAL
jgi:acetyltransferase